MINKVILVGNVGSDPEIRTLETGVKVARFNIATTERYTNQQTQERSEKTEWHRLVLWRGLASVAEQYIRKGSQLYIEGRLRNTEWQDANGQKRFGVEIQVDIMNMLGRRDAQSAAQHISQPQNGGYQQQMQSAPQPQSNPYKMTESQYDAPVGGGDVMDDDLPF